MPAMQFDRFVRYAELTEIVHAFADEHPELISLESIGRSHEGRDIWLVSATNRATGAAADKPAFWVDGNIHSTEVAASVANLYFLNELVTQYRKDPDTVEYSSLSLLRRADRRPDGRRHRRRWSNPADANRRPERAVEVTS